MSRDLLTRPLCAGLELGEAVFHRTLKLVRIVRLALPHDDASPTEFAHRALVEFVAGGVAFEFLQPPGAAMSRRRAILAARMPVPKAAVDEDSGFVLRKNNIRPHEPTPDPSAEGNLSARAIWHPCASVFNCGFIQSFANGDMDVPSKAVAEPMQQ